MFLWIFLLKNIIKILFFSSFVYIAPCLFFLHMFVDNLRDQNCNNDEDCSCISYECSNYNDKNRTMSFDRSQSTDMSPVEPIHGNYFSLNDSLNRVSMSDCFSMNCNRSLAQSTKGSDIENKSSKS